MVARWWVWWLLSCLTAIHVAADDRLAALLDGIGDVKASGKGAEDEKKKKAAPAVRKDLPMPLGFFSSLSSLQEAYNLECGSTMKRLNEHAHSLSGIASRRRSMASQFMKMVCEALPPRYNKMDWRTREAIYKESIRDRYGFQSSSLTLLFQLTRPADGRWNSFRISEVGHDALSCVRLLMTSPDKDARHILAMPYLACRRSL